MTCRFLSRLALYLVASTPLATAATFTVTNTNDSGTGSLRWAIDQANSASGTDRITFAIPGAGPHLIEPLTELPAISSTLDIDGSTQPGFAGSPRIVLSGRLAAPALVFGNAVRILAVGLQIGANDCLVRGLCIHSWPRFDPGREPRPYTFVGASGSGGVGVMIRGHRNSVTGCYIGCDPTGMIAMPNAIGVSIAVEASNNYIGTILEPMQKRSSV